MRALKRTTKRVLVSLPLPLRKQLAWLADRLAPGRRLSFELLADMSRGDVEEFHRFLWSRHLAYADTYEPGMRFGGRNIRGTRRLLAWDLRATLTRLGFDPAGGRTVLDVGSSMGYLLRHMETTTLPGATRLDGIDIDARAIRTGREHLRAVGSRVRLTCGDVTQLGEHFGDQRYDVVLCCGVLLYLEEATAAGVVASALERTGGVLALSGLAQPDIDNRELEHSTARSNDSTFVHNLDRMIEAAGGHVVHRRWNGRRLLDGNSVYFVFGAPGPGRDAVECGLESPRS